MPDFWNTVGNLRFYNFISNRYFNGVPPASSSQFTRSFLWSNWFSQYVFPSNPSVYSANLVCFYFPRVVGTPTENESCTGTANTTNNFRFRFFNNFDLTLFFSDNGSCSINTQNTDSASTNFIVNNVYGQSNTNASSLDYVFPFGVASPTTVALFDFLLPNQPIKSLTNYTTTQFYIAGWLHDGAAPTPFTDANLRYNNCFTITGSSPTRTATQSLTRLDIRRPTATGSTTLQDMGVIRYYDINCLTGSYTPGLFFTDLILRDNLSASGFPMRGKVDNRVVCLGRGSDFVVGQVYRANNIFGRTGAEDWMCVCPWMPSSQSFTSWTPTNTFRRDVYKAWTLGQYDFLMIRIYTEAD